MGVEQDDVVAFNWFTRAAESGYPPAQYSLGVMYSKGRGVTKDYIKAYGWLFAAATADEPHARTVLKKLRKKMSREELLKGGVLGERLSLEYGS